MSQYHQLTYEQRYYIEVSVRNNVSQTEIAKCLGVHKSTISRELKRNRGQRGYRKKQAQEKAVERRRSKYNRRISDSTWAFVEDRLRCGHSPEAISGRMKLEGCEPVSHESIYLYVYADREAGGELYTFLVSQKPRRKKHRVGKDRRGQIIDRVSIDKRPAVVDELSRTGDWEVDTVVGSNHQGAIVTMNERRSGINLAVPVSNKSAALVRAAIIKALTPYRHWVHTITSDNGKEFAEHKQIAGALDCEFYFAHPYHSWERGRNENSNGRLRRYFPKGTSFQNLSQKEVDIAVEKMLDTPRKMLDFKTPREAFLIQTGIYVTNNSYVALHG